MASTKVVSVLDNNVTLVAAAANNTSSVATLTTGYGGQLSIKITNGATGPTVAAQAQIQTSPDGTNYYSFGGALVAALGNAVVSSWSISIPVGIQYLRVVSGSNTGQNVVIRAEISAVTAIS